MDRKLITLLPPALLTSHVYLSALGLYNVKEITVTVNVS